MSLENKDSFQFQKWPIGPWGTLRKSGQIIFKSLFEIPKGYKIRAYIQ
jgi:hypothetical protein